MNTNNCLTVTRSSPCLLAKQMQTPANAAGQMSRGGRHG